MTIEVKFCKVCHTPLAFSNHTGRCSACKSNTAKPCSWCGDVSVITFKPKDAGNVGLCRSCEDKFIVRLMFMVARKKSKPRTKSIVETFKKKYTLDAESVEEVDFLVTNYGAPSEKIFTKDGQELRRDVRSLIAHWHKLIEESGS